MEHQSIPAARTPQRRPRAAIAARTVLIARELAVLTPEVLTVHLTPVWTDGSGEPHRSTLVFLLDANGREVPAGPAAHRIARHLLHTNFAQVDWSRPHTYDVRTGALALMGAPAGPRELDTPALDAEAADEL